MATADFRLTDSERHHPLWVKLAAHFAARLHDLRGKNDDPNLTEAQTAALRGQINCLKGLIILGNDPPQTGQE